MKKRIICDFILFVFIFLAPWWWTAGLAAAFIIFFPRFWEGVAAVFIIDSIYYLPSGSFSAKFGILTLSFLALFYAAYAIKGRIRFIA